MIIDSWLITTDANSVPKSADALPALATSANIVAVEVVSAGVGVYSVRATLMDDALVASALLSWAVDSIGYVQQMVFSRGVVDVNVVSFADAASTGIASTITGDVNVSAQTRVVVPVNSVPYKVVRDIDNQIIIRKYAGFSYTLQDVGDLAGVTKITFTVKGNRRLDLDEESLIQVVLTIPADAADGIKYLNKAAAISGDIGEGSIAVQTYTESDISKKRIVVSVSDKATAKIPVLDNAVFDIKQFVSGDSDILDEGTVKVIEATTWTVSS